ncbi:MAG: hypothetical protein D6773_19660 [Alphaproteobacteria bacterium]|nr:MAG: hypothetical protein D6773_19660 [Alphaproteobacteria bacterium]
MPAVGSLRFFLGGRDLEMETIATLLRETVGGDRVEDAGLGWGARASAYGEAIARALECGETPVLVELEDDLPPHIDRAKLIIVDHHGDRAGRNQPSSLRQVFGLLADEYGLNWTRAFELVEANDIGHVAEMKARGANDTEIRAIRQRDRRAQGVSEAEEREAARAIAAREHDGPLTIVRIPGNSASAVGDLILPELGGPGADALLVVMPEEFAFFGPGNAVLALNGAFDGWYGGALPERGFWGCERKDDYPGEEAVRQTAIAALEARSD